MRTSSLALGSTACFLGAACLLVASCKPPAPELPPADSMTFLEFKKGQVNVEAGQEATSQALTTTGGNGTTQNVEGAALAVGLVTLGVNLALLTPRMAFWGVLSDAPDKSGDTWVWKKTFPLAGWSAEMRAREQTKLEIEMFLTGLRGEQISIKNFRWYTGSHEATQGDWVIYDPKIDGPVVNIHWSRRSATDKDVTFTNVTTNRPESGDVLAYALRGKVASMSIDDAKDASGVPAQFDVHWNTSTGEGKMTLKTGVSYCWDTLANGQVDIACPAGAWPLP